ncbi:hypothetical protein BCF59_0493 [Mycoplasmopsis mustelae]|uniref:Uncharacterized protein n=1 Tax=Mycoplasmopsis mustelae TaxID=171289 RepID=A0A4R7UEA7_9BACT|nr:hypothetical protein [Mycoplasmopsis mustelae]TDV23504.1 hypothetical protein BCF59_0493 [Mycoplasmopsis mustelae]
MKITENDVAYEIYQKASEQIKDLPKFWFQIVENDKDAPDQALLFYLENSLSLPVYFNDNYKYINFSILYGANRNEHPKQLSKVKELINFLAHTWTFNSFDIVLMKLNGVTFTQSQQENLRYLLLSQPIFDLLSQEYKINYEIAITSKGAK